MEIKIYKKTKNFISGNNREKGSVLIIAIFSVFIPLTIGLMLSALIFSQIKIFQNLGYSNKSFYGAFTGIERALYENIDPVSISGSVDGVTYEALGPISNFISSGSFKDTSRFIEVTF